MKRIFTLITILCALGAGAQGVKPLPSLHTEGRWLVDKHGNQVVLHGVMDTPSNYFNGGRWEGSKALGWWDHYNEDRLPMRRARQTSRSLIPSAIRNTCHSYI